MADVDDKYRLRTWLRGHLPPWLSWVAPKGKSDCGNHEWYRSEGITWRCYHCEAGVTEESPWSPEEETKIRIAALLESLRVLNYRPLTPETVREERELVRELSETLAREEELVSAP